MIVANIDEMKEYLPTILLQSGSNVLNDALDIAEVKIRETILGDTLTDALNVAPASPDEYAPLRKIVKRAISLEAFIDSVPELDLILTDAGFAVQSNQAMTPASRQRVDKMIESLRKRRDSAFDAVVTFLSKSEDGDLYHGWRDTNQSEFFAMGLMCTLGDFIRHKVSLEKTVSWTEFYGLIPKMGEGLTERISTYISRAYAFELQSAVRTGATLEHNEKMAIQYIKRAVTSYALGDMKFCDDNAIAARQYMLNYPEDFPTFTASPEAASKSKTHVNQAIQNFL